MASNNQKVIIKRETLITISVPHTELHRMLREAGYFPPNLNISGEENNYYEFKFHIQDNKTID